MAPICRLIDSEARLAILPVCKRLTSDKPFDFKVTGWKDVGINCVADFRGKEEPFGCLKDVAVFVGNFFGSCNGRLASRQRSDSDHLILHVCCGRYFCGLALRITFGIGFPLIFARSDQRLDLGVP